MKEDAAFSQQEGRRIPFQMQKAVNAEIKRLLKEGHIEKLDEIKDDIFIHSTDCNNCEERPFGKNTLRHLSIN